MATAGSDTGLNLYPVDGIHWGGGFFFVYSLPACDLDI